MHDTPQWLKKRLTVNDEFFETKRLLKELGLATVCESGICPNLHECFSRRTATFMILGERCTRACAFCAVAKGRPAPVDADEPAGIAQALGRMRARYAVITSVTRDDLADGGASHFASVIEAVGAASPGTAIEVLVPDFRGDEAAIATVVEAKPDVFGHNIETVERLYVTARAGSDYRRSLAVLKVAKELDAALATKSGIMLGLGEKEDEVIKAIEDLRAASCDILTIGQYLQPRGVNLPVAAFIEPANFKRYESIGSQLGFKHVAAGPFVRSSYLAEEAYSLIMEKMGTVPKASIAR